MTNCGCVRLMCCGATGDFAPTWRARYGLNQACSSIPRACASRTAKASGSHAGDGARPCAPVRYSDHANYARYGIPVTFFTTGGHSDYHELTDEAQYIDYEHYRAVVEFVYDVARTVANRDARLVVDKPKPDPRGECRQ